MVKIVADTLSCIYPGKAKELGIPYLPQIIIFGDESYHDDSEIDSETFLSKLISSETLPKTAAPSPALCTPIYQEAWEKKESVLVRCPSKELNGTIKSAEVAAQDFPDVDIRIFDTRTPAGSLAAYVMEGYEMAKQGTKVEKSLDTSIKCFVVSEHIS